MPTLHENMSFCKLNSQLRHRSHRCSRRLTAPGGMSSSLSGSPLRLAGPRPPNGPSPEPPLPPMGLPGTTGSNFAPGGAPIGGKYPSPPHGPRLGGEDGPPRGPNAPPKMGWSGPTNIPSPPEEGNNGGGANGLRPVIPPKGSKSLLPTSRGLREGSFLRIFLLRISSPGTSGRAGAGVGSGRCASMPRDGRGGCELELAISSAVSRSFEPDCWDGRSFSITAILNCETNASKLMKAELSEDASPVPRSRGNEADGATKLLIGMSMYAVLSD